MIAILAVRDAQLRRDLKQQSLLERKLRIGDLTASSGIREKIVRVQEEQTVSFNPCELWGHTPVQESVVQLGNIPAFVVSQWRTDCPPKWSVARMLGVNDTGLLSDPNFRAMRRVDVALCLIIAVQWLLIGSFPLIQPKRWWAEPAAFITTCTAIASGIALIPGLDVLGRLPALIALLAWLWWFGLLLWKLFQLAWQSTLGGQRRLSN